MIPSLTLARALLLALLDLAVGFVAPPTCAACPERVPRGRSLCRACAVELEPVPWSAAPRDGVRAPFVYGGAIRAAIRAFKYGGRPDLSRPLGHLLRADLRAHPIRADLVVPVPLHPRRRAERGHDQAALLAGQVAEELGIPCKPSALRRAVHGPAQVTLDREARLAGASLRFFAPRPLRGLRVLLVDDVVTTGATVAACRAALLAAGASRVDVIALARAVRYDDA